MSYFKTKLLKIKTQIFFLSVLLQLMANSVSAEGLTNPLGNTKDPREIIGLAIQGAMSILGSLALAMFVYGGFVWMLSAGNTEKIEKGKRILTWAFIGLVVIFSSYAVLSFILGKKFLAPFLVI